LVSELDNSAGGDRGGRIQDPLGNVSSSQIMTKRRD
jgi:hypothetical protein